MKKTSAILLTGPPRSGTTLMCHLLNKLPNSVALAEPMDVFGFRGLPPQRVIAKVDQFAQGERAKILKLGIATSKASGGSVPTNTLSDERVHSVRRKLVDGKVLEVSNVTRSDFNLYIKHPAFFTACLPFLSSVFECFASVRNPLAILLSWRDCDLPVSAGRLPAAEQMNEELKSRLDSEKDVLARQLILLDFVFDQYHRFLPDRVVRYEDIVSSNGRVLSRITAEATALAEDLVSRNYRQLGNDPDAHAIADRLMATDNACWNFYDKSDVEELFIRDGDVPPQLS